MSKDAGGPVISKIVSGGQTGADRGALEAAKALGIPYGGWCPKGGWAEDLPNPPGLLKAFPNLQETPSGDPEQRTEWNVRDSDATLILRPINAKSSAGTDFTETVALRLDRPFIELDPVSADAKDTLRKFLATQGSSLTLNVAGPRESQSPGLQDSTRQLIISLLKNERTQAAAS